MAYQGITIFVVFFGISLLDALWTGHWARAAFWTAMGLAFWALDRMRRTRGAKSDPSRPATGA
jgi:hypothetical protein